MILQEFRRENTLRCSKSITAGGRVRGRDTESSSVNRPTAFLNVC